MMINIIDFIFLYTIYIFLYNVGMYVFSRAFKVRVNKFYVWFGSRFQWFKFKKGHTEYGLGWMPLGGYLKISGMLLEEGEEIQPYHFKAAAVVKQILIISSGPLVCLFLGVLVYMYKLPTIPAEFYYYTLGYLAFLALVLVVYKQLTNWMWQRREKGAVQGNAFTAFVLAVFFWALLMSPALFYVDALTPFFEEVRAIFTSEQELSFAFISQDAWVTIVAFFGVWFFFTNIIPMGGLNGSILINSLYTGIAGEEMSSKISTRYQFITVPLVMVAYGYLIYVFLF